MMDSKSKIQIFVIDSSGCFEDTARLAIECSLKIFLETFKTNFDAWNNWLSGTFTKNVRRAKSSSFDKVVKDCSVPEFFMVQKDVSRCLAFAPMSYSDMSKSLSKLQVSDTFLFHRDGLTVLNDEIVHSDDMIIAMDASLGLSDGKMIAQICHVAWGMLLKLVGSKDKLFELSDEYLNDFIDQICHSQIFMLGHDDFKHFSNMFNEVVIKDNALTELSEPTITGVAKVH